LSRTRRYGGLREKRMDGKTLAATAAAAGMCERTARRWQDGALPSATKIPRTWRTRPDPFADIWASDIVPRLAADEDRRLQALSLFEWLCDRYPGRFQPGQLRTLQRRVRDWRAQHGPDLRGYFEQTAVPGCKGALDFTDASDLGVTIQGDAFPHLLFEWVLSFSGWTYAALAASETFEALVAGLQGAVWTLGAVPAIVRHDNLSAATHELKRSGGRQLTERFRGVLDHYGLRSSRIHPGEAHENGVVEQAHFRTKTAVERASLLRGHADFVDEASCETFVRQVVERTRNARGAPAGGGARVLASAAAGARPQLHDVHLCRAALEHDPRGQADVLGALAVDWAHGRGAAASEDGGGPLSGAGHRNDAAAPWRR
jgi:hypothetical protein